MPPEISVGIHVNFYYPRPTLATIGMSQQKLLLTTSNMFYENAFRISKFYIGN